MALQGQKMRGVADVVFVLDVSGSMSPVIEAVKNHISTFVDSMRVNSQTPIDLRLGLVTHLASGGSRRGVREWPFTESVDEFRTRLAGCDVDDGEYDEFGLPALDMALDFPWRPQCRRFVISFTDEPVEGGDDPSFQRAKIQDLVAKFAALKVNGYILAPECPDYDAVSGGPRMVRVTLSQEELATFDFSTFLADLGKTVSQTSEDQAATSVSPNLYGI